MRNFGFSLGLRPGLYRALQEPEQRKLSGRDLSAKASDADVLRVRQLRDWHRRSWVAIAKLTGLDPLTCKAICEYRCDRRFLKPGPKPKAT